MGKAVWIRGMVLCFAVALSANASEFVLLSTGFRIRADRHEQSGNLIRIYTQGGGVTEMEAVRVTGFEPDQSPSEAAETVPSPQKTQPGAVDARSLVTEAALRHGLPPAFVQSVALVESGLRENAVSRKGALGIMQLMPETAWKLNANPYDPAENVDAGVRYLTQLLLKYKDEPDQVRRALAAYNAGSQAVDKHNGIPPYRETIDYVRKVLVRQQQLQKKLTD